MKPPTQPGARWTMPALYIGTLLVVVLGYILGGRELGPTVNLVALVFLVACMAVISRRRAG